MAEKIVTKLVGDRIIGICSDYNITGKPGTKEIEVWAANGEYLELRSFKANVDPQVRRFVLFHTDLPIEVIRGSLFLLKTERICCGFDVKEALRFEVVYAVGPFTQADLTPLVMTRVNVDNAAPFDSSTTLREYLKAKLQG